MAVDIPKAVLALTHIIWHTENWIHLWGSEEIDCDDLHDVRDLAVNALHSLGFKWTLPHLKDRKGWWSPNSNKAAYEKGAIPVTNHNEAKEQS